MKTIWLCSWYPNAEDEFTGDFIRRQAIAVSAFADIEVVHVVFCQREQYVASRVNDRLTEHIYYRVKGADFTNFLTYAQVHLSFIRAYKKRNGKPALVHVQIPFKAGVVAVAYKCFFGIPYLVSEHYGIYNDLLDDEYASRSAWFKFFTRLVVQQAEVLTTVSRSLGEDMNALVAQKLYTVVSNVVDTQLFKFSEPPAGGKFRFIHISNMIPLKNIRGIIDTAAMLWQTRQDFEIVIVGEIKQEYVDLAFEKKLLNSVVYFKGIVPYIGVAQEISQSNALIIFSDTESQSCVVLEALCSGRPAIVTNVGGVKELVAAHNGLKVNTRDNHDLFVKMNQLIDTYSAYDLKKIAEDASAQYSYESVGRKFYDIYLKMIS